MSSTRTDQSTPVISKVLADGTLIETIFDRMAGTTSLAIGTPEGMVSVAAYYDLPTGERLVPYAPTNNLIATGCVLLPSAVGSPLDKTDLLTVIREYLHRYVDLSPLFEDIAAYYVLLTWVYDAFNELPYLRFRGEHGTAKTRALMTIGSVCYKPFFASGASTVSPIFHVLDAFAGTLILDEADLRFSDATADLTKILNNGNARGLPVLRTMTNRHKELNPQAFRVYGPKIIGMRESFADKALESRFLTEDTGTRPLRPDVPIHQPDSLHIEAQELRNQLLAWRFQTQGSIGSDPSRVMPGLEPRRNQTALALLSLIDDADLRERIRHELVGEEARVRDERASTSEATVLACLYEAFQGQTLPFVSVSDVTRRFNDRMEQDLGTLVTPKWIGGILRSRLRIATHKSRGIYVVPCTERKKVDALRVRYGLVALSPSSTAE